MKDLIEKYKSARSVRFGDLPNIWQISSYNELGFYLAGSLYFYEWDYKFNGDVFEVAEFRMKIPEYLKNNEI